MSERVPLAMYPERPSEHAESFKRAIEIFSRPPEFELSEQQRQEVIDFEQTICGGLLPAELGYLENSIQMPSKTIAEISSIQTGIKSPCLDWFVQTPEGQQNLLENHYTGDTSSKEAISRFLASAILAKKTDNQPGIEVDESRIWAKGILESNLSAVLNGEESANDPNYIALLSKPGELVETIESARRLKAFYKTIEVALGQQPNSQVLEAKQLMLRLHRERVNTLIATSYRDVLPLLNQYRLSSECLTSQEVEQLYGVFPALKGLDTTDNHRMARIYSMIDKFIEGVDRENGFSQISTSIEMLEKELVAAKPSETHKKVVAIESIDLDTRIDSTQLQTMVSTILREYGLLKEEDGGGYADW